MADSRNMELNDSMMAGAVGGRLGELGEAKYKIGQVVKVHLSEGEYGQTLSGTVVGIEATLVTWSYSVEVQSNDGIFIIKMPEYALEA